jgi:hypothetical protein
MSDVPLLKKAIDYDAEFERVFEEFRDNLREVGCWTECDEANLDDWNDSLASLFYAFIREKQVGAIKEFNDFMKRSVQSADDLKDERSKHLFEVIKKMFVEVFGE